MDRLSILRSKSLGIVDISTLLLSLLYISATAFLETESEVRLVVADIILVGLMLVILLSFFAGGRLVVSTIHLSALPMLFAFLISTLLANYIERAALELLITFFGLLGSIAMVSLLLRLPETWLRKFVQGYVFVIGGISFVSLVDFLLVPSLFGNLAVGGLQGPFRNTGQAGSFFGVHLAIVLAFVVGGVVPRTGLNISLVTLTSLALLFTLKRASLVAFAVGLILLATKLVFSMRQGQRRIAVVFTGFALFVGIGGALIFGWAQESVAEFGWRFSHKYSADVLSDFSGGFFAENLKSTVAALNESPLLGVGLDNVRGIYQYHEIHSTYLGVLAYGGLLGAIGYLLFIGAFVSMTYSESKSEPKNDWTMFLYILLPLLIGLLIGWGYTYHIRKREFWILVTFVVIAIHMSKRLRIARKRNEDEIRSSDALSL